MKIKVDEVEIHDFPQWKKNVIAHDISSDILDEDLKRRLVWSLEHKFERSYERFEKEWLAKLREDNSIGAIPKSQEDFVNLVLSLPTYKSRKQRDEEANAQI